MEKRLYFCDVCGKEIENKEEFYEISVEGAIMVKRPWDTYHFYNSNKEKQYITLLVCNDCYESEKRKGSFILAQYDSMRDEINRKIKEERESTREVPKNE